MGDRKSFTGKGNKEKALPRLGMGGRGKRSGGVGVGLIKTTPVQLNLSSQIKNNPELLGKFNAASAYLAPHEVPKSLHIYTTTDPEVYGERRGNRLYISRNAIRTQHPLFGAAIIFHEGMHTHIQGKTQVIIENKIRTQVRNWARQKLFQGKGTPEENRVLRRIIMEQQPFSNE